MRIAVVADIHGNLDAFEAVVADAGSVDAWWCLGDVVGYGADPNGCMDLLRRIDAVTLPGNHDLAAVGRLDLEQFNADAAACLAWTAGQLRPEHAAYLRALPERVIAGDFTLVHASPRHPVWEYVHTPAAARANFAHFTTAYCLVGHTHQPAAFDERGRQDFAGAATAAYDGSSRRYLCNPGGVGQPRDGNPRAAYLLIDDGIRRWQWRRVAYDIARAASRILATGLPVIEAQRLTLGC